jgi:hypothetical protein
MDQRYDQGRKPRFVSSAALAHVLVVMCKLPSLVHQRLALSKKCLSITARLLRATPST